MCQTFRLESSQVSFISAVYSKYRWGDRGNRQKDIPFGREDEVTFEELYSNIL